MVDNALRSLALGATAFLGAAADQAIDSTTHVSLGGAVAVGFVVAGWAIWLGREFQKIKDRDVAVKTALETQEAKDVLRFETLQRQIAALPCRLPDCPTHVAIAKSS